MSVIGERPKPTTDRVADTLRDGIRTGRWVPGQRLVEADLMRELGVGRNTVREALSRLRSDGLILLEAHRGASVRELTQRDAAELYAVREVLEGLAARQAADRVGAPGVRERLLAGLRALDAEHASGAGARYMDANLAFHRLIAELADNEQLLAFLDQLQIRTFAAQVKESWRTMGDRGLVDRAHAQHHEVAEAVLAGDAARAERVMRRHVARTATDMLDPARDAFA